MIKWVFSCQLVSTGNYSNSVHFTKVQFEGLIKFQNKAFKNISQKSALECYEKAESTLSTNKTQNVFISEMSYFMCMTYLHCKALALEVD